ncbi:MAG: CotH kinase family protein, partial [Acutalibacteraceae bacterium]
NSKLWNNSPLLTYDEYKNGKNCVFISDVNGNGSVGVYGGNTEVTNPSEPSSEGDSSVLAFGKSNALYVHGVLGVDEKEAWQKWFTSSDNKKYFFLPSSANDKKVEIYNSFSVDVTVGETVISANSIGEFEYTKDSSYTVNAGDRTYTLLVKKSSGEGAVYVNNAGDFNGKDLYSYLCEQKSNSSSATGAVTDNSGNIDNTEIKKIKGRGNTSWDKDKKGFNITYKSAISVCGMEKTKKYSMLANYQDASLLRNRFLYDLSDKVNIPYASDSRFVDFFINGEYIGSYQMCQKVEVGADALVSDISGEEYLNTDGTLSSQFPFMIEIDGSAGSEDNYIEVQSNKITINAPEMDSTMAYYNDVRSYIKSKTETMFDKLSSNASDLSDYIDIDSFAKVYLINELGKNWDAGVSSYYFVYKQDENGKYKFYASPVWDYDNSLGNCVGISRDLERMNVSDYEEPSGYWVRYKFSQTGRTSNSFSAVAAKSTSAVFQRAKTIWWESFVPAIQKFLSTNISSGELYSSDVYYNILKDSAEINYLSGWELNTGEWICDHSNLTVGKFDYSTNKYTENYETKYYSETFKGEYDYTVDWLKARTDWLSSAFVGSYVPPIEDDDPIDDPTKDPVIYDNSKNKDAVGGIASWYFNSNSKVTGEKLSDFENEKEYKATKGNGTLKMSVNGTSLRSLEWSAGEYGESGTDTVPIMPAGSKNLWIDPYIELAFSAKDFSDISISMDFAGSSKAPANWKVTYSLDGENFT